MYNLFVLEMAVEKWVIKAGDWRLLNLAFLESVFTLWNVHDVFIPAFSLLISVLSFSIKMCIDLAKPIL